MKAVESNPVTATTKTECFATYARYSTERQDARSIDDQQRRCRALTATHGATVYADEYAGAAQSGAHINRAALQRLLSDGKRRGGAPFSAVVVDDLSRLSRDLGDTWRIIFDELASVGVRVIDATTGMASNGARARLTFGALALVNDTFLELVRTETHRGLEGRAIAGFSTGGRVFGYATMAEPNPPDPERPRMQLVINAPEAAIVLRIFELYAIGYGFASIARLLNDEHIAAPHDGGKGNKHGRGWQPTTTRAILLNERHVGKWVWNKRKFVRKGSTRKRRAQSARHPSGERLSAPIS